MTVLLVLGGLVGLLVGAEVLVRGGTGLATRFGVPPMVIGLTVVSIGTSLPELAIGIDAARTGSPALAVGNIVGTNLVNLLFILGLSALLVPIAFERRTLRNDHRSAPPGAAIGMSMPCRRAVSSASGYPASACRTTPSPGSHVSTRWSFSSASRVPSATTTMPAWSE